MTDDELLRKKIAFIETCVQELHDLARPERIGDDIREERFVEHTLQLAIQAALDAASHIVSDQRLGEPESNRELFTLLANHGWLDPKRAETLTAMAGFRNILVHGYQRVDLAVLHDILDNHLNDLLGYVGSIRARLGG